MLANALLLTFAMPVAASGLLLTGAGSDGSIDVLAAQAPATWAAGTELGRHTTGAATTQGGYMHAARAAAGDVPLPSQRAAGTGWAQVAMGQHLRLRVEVRLPVGRRHRLHLPHTLAAGGQTLPGRDQGRAREPDRDDRRPGRLPQVPARGKGQQTLSECISC